MVCLLLAVDCNIIFNEAKLWFPENVTHIDIKITLVDMS